MQSIVVISLERRHVVIVMKSASSLFKYIAATVLFKMFHTYKFPIIQMRLIILVVLIFTLTVAAHVFLAAQQTDWS